jgi:hypothetical protein
MHEVLAVILYALQQEAGSLGGDHPYSYLTDPAFLEHDVFVIFEKVMMELEVRTIYKCFIHIEVCLYVILYTMGPVAASRQYNIIGLTQSSQGLAAGCAVHCA